MKNFNDLKKWLAEHGYTYERGASGHYKIRRPNGSFATTMPCTPSDRRSFMNTIRDLKKAGIPVP